MKKRQNSARIMLIASMLIFGTIGIFRRSIALSSSALAMTRGLIGTAALLLIVLLCGKKPQLSALRRAGLPLVLSGAFIGINWILLFEAYNHTTVAVATLCYYMAPILVILVSPFLLREKLTPVRLGCTAAALVGMLLISGVLSETDSGDPAGILFGLGAAAFYAAVILMNRKITGVGALERTIVQLFSAGIVLLPYVFLTGQANYADLTPVSWGLTLVVCVVHTGLAYALYFGSMEALPAQTVALCSYLDPVTAILLSALLLSEPMGPAQIAGTVLVLGAAAVSELWGAGRSER